MILDASADDCQTANFNIGPQTASARQWDIRVTQYTCGQEDVAGPDGCLQYYTGSSGTIQNFAFPSASTLGTECRNLIRSVASVAS